jgi:hypothetical protein
MDVDRRRRLHLYVGVRGLFVPKRYDWKAENLARIIGKMFRFIRATVILALQPESLRTGNEISSTHMCA